MVNWSWVVLSSFVAHAGPLRDYRNVVVEKVDAQYNTVRYWIVLSSFVACVGLSKETWWQGLKQAEVLAKNRVFPSGKHSGCVII